MVAPTSVRQREHTSTREASHGHPHSPSHGSAPKPAGRWALIIAGGYAAGLVASALGVPSPFLLASVLVGVVLALSGGVRDRLPGPANRSSQALVGALMGSHLTPSALMSAAPAALPLTAVTAATIALSVAVAWLLARGRRISRPSAVLGMMPGGSAASVASADELNADARLVAFIQYLRVGLVATTAPLAAHWMSAASAAGPPGGGPGHRAGPGLFPLVAGPDQATGLLTLAAVSVFGVRAGRRLRLPTPALIGPMLAALVATMSGVIPPFAPAGVLQDIVFVLVGMDVGVRFTGEAVRRVRRLLPSILAGMVAVCLGCAGLAWIFAKVTGTPVIDAYLATTPGGINAVLAAAVTSHGDVALVSTVQSLRLLVVVLMTPLIIRRLTPSNHHRTPVDRSDSSIAKKPRKLLQRC
ncbi:AbrB family transcriptional regulator [Streptomyces sp. NPDC059568]|uniref:AbrB family transcriptional regulator n=1 Tax=Streptomyces sp. NPDC059568 TaxID=3346868 RepID=UPI0036C1E5AD